MYSVCMFMISSLYYLIHLCIIIYNYIICVLNDCRFLSFGREIDWKQKFIRSLRKLKFIFDIVATKLENIESLEKNAFIFIFLFRKKIRKFLKYL